MLMTKCIRLKRFRACRMNFIDSEFPVRLHFLRIINLTYSDNCRTYGGLRKYICFRF
jgi:hypothetical protein